MDNVEQYLTQLSFEREIGGGGCDFMSLYLESGTWVWVTCIDGGGMPESDNWLICTYQDDIDTILYQASSESLLTLEQATLKACDIARHPIRAID